MDRTQYDAATKLVPTLTTDSVDKFREALIAVDFPWDNDKAIEWWKCMREQRVALEKLVAPGKEQTKCKLALTQFCTPMSPGQAEEAVAGAVTGEFDRSGWFKYFFYEAAVAIGKAADTDMNRILVLDIAQSFFVKTGASYLTKRTYNSVDAHVFKQLLTVLLSVGFERVPATKQRMLAGDSSSALIMNYLRWSGEAPAEGLKSPDGDIKRISAEFKWRCDSRAYSVVKQCNGFDTKSKSEGYAKAKGLREAWHPFSDEGLRSYLWFRKGQTDNCLYTVVSVGVGDWQAFAVYPKISLSGGKAEKLGGYLGKRKVRCLPKEGGKPVELELAVSETYLYFFLQVGAVFDTGAAQGSTAYPEVGMASIPMKNVFGALRFVRYHRGEPDTVTDDDGMVVVIDKSGTHTNDDDAKSIAASCGEELYRKAQLSFNAVRDAAPTGVKWTPTGYATIPLGAMFAYGDNDYKIDQVLTA